MNRPTFLIVGCSVAVVTGLFLLIGRAAPTDPAPQKPYRTVSAIGSATVAGTPDSARVYLGVLTKGKTVAEASAENARLVGDIQAALRALSLANLKARTLYSNVSIIHAENDRSKITGYEVRQGFTVLVKEPDSEKLGATAGRILDAGLKHGANNLVEIEFFKADDTDLRRQAMSKAVEDAVANAQAYAAGAKAKSVEVAEIKAADEDLEPRGGGQQGGGPGAGNGEASIIAGAWTVTTRVRVVCRF